MAIPLIVGFVTVFETRAEQRSRSHMTQTGQTATPGFDWLLSTLVIFEVQKYRLKPRTFRTFACTPRPP
jgi:hypothetical protein